MLLTVKNLKIHFRHDGEIVEAVRGIDFAINENEVVGLVGESGSGKTVSALSITKLLPKGDSVVTGEVMFGGKNLLDANEEEIRRVRGSKIAMIFQEPSTSLNPVLKIGEQIDEAILAHRKISKKNARKNTIELLGKVNLNDPERICASYPHLLSGGERQRAMIAMAISLEPELLIADEPTTALDVTIQSEILKLLLELKKELRMSVIFITHDFGIINKIAERVLVMKNGKIIEEGKKEDILSFPKAEYTKKLLLAVPKITIKPETREENPAKMGRVLIEAKNLNKAFAIEKGLLRNTGEKIRAVVNVNLKIEEGKTVGLVGESGSGKTTLARLLLGLIQPDSGKVTIPRRVAQIVFQDPYSSLDPRMRMRDIVLEGPTIRGASKAEKVSILKDVLSKTQLDYEERMKYPHQFSGGQRQRIAIARALAVNPKILILDEPVSSLDVLIQSDILKLLKDLQKTLSLTYVFISHDLRVVEYMADEVAVMYKGEIVELASRDRIYTSAQHPYTRRLLSSVL
ncbi:MAG: ABC transporter ATP-binding protein [Candidatus Omnitrophica bacterium]|nr:ABC transporter ATP-binding protein [Candidatus Omnitrophota bacterium]